MADVAAILAAGDPHLHRLAVLSATVLAGIVIARDSRAWPLAPQVRRHVLAATALGGMLGSALPALVAGGIAGDMAQGLLAEQADAVVRVGRWFFLGPKTVVGGLLGAFLGVALYKRLAGVPYDTSDAFARGTAVLLLVGRLGCVAQHCCFGVPTGGAWGVDLGDGVPRVPVQALEAGVDAVLLALIATLHHRDLLPGRRLFLLFTLYGLARCALETLREPFGATWLGVGAYQWLALLLAAIGLKRLVWREAGPAPA